MTDKLPFEWKISSDEETWYDTNATDRESAIAFGRKEYGGESFSICEARKQKFPYHLLFDAGDAFERMMDDGEEYWGEDQDGPICSALTIEQVRDLETMVIDAFKAWVEKHSIKLEHPWAFGEMRNIEKIEESK